MHTDLPPSTSIPPKKHHYRLVRGVARFRWLRELLAGIYVVSHRRSTARFVAEQHDNLAASLFAVDIDRLSRCLRTDGYSLGLHLPSDLLVQLQTHARTSRCFADRDPSLGFLVDDRARAEAALGKEILLAECFNARASCDAVDRIANDPLIQIVAARHLGSTPRLVGTSLWWTFPVDASESDRMHHAHFFHRDVDDFRFVKFFFYLTDVNLNDGGHVIVRGSHRRQPFVRTTDRFLLRRFDDDEIEQFYGANHIVEVGGAAGTGFVENTLCVHKGLTPTHHPRLILQLEFALFDYGLSHDDREPSELRSILDLQDR